MLPLLARQPDEGRMNARLERKLRLLSGIVAAGIIAGIAFSAAMDRSLIAGVAYGLLISLMLGGIELFIMEGPMLVWLSGLSFMKNLIVRSAIYAAIIMILQWFQVGEAIAGLPAQCRVEPSGTALSILP